MVGRVLIDASWRPITDVLDLLNHPGHSSQKSHGRRGGAEALREAADSPLKASRALGGGKQGETTLEEHEKGTIVRKEFAAGSESKALVDSEVLASRVADAVGVQAPAVVALDRRTVIMEHVPGQTWAERGGELPQDLIDSDQGRLLGLHDVLVGNADRSPGNFMIDKGRLTAIDHGYGFQASPMAGLQSPFAAHYSGGSAFRFADRIDISPGDMATVRGRLTDLRGDFEALGRGRWHDEMMDRVDRLEPAATGTRDRL